MTKTTAKFVETQQSPSKTQPFFSEKRPDLFKTEYLTESDNSDMILLVSGRISVPETIMLLY